MITIYTEHNFDDKYKLKSDVEPELVISTDDHQEIIKTLLKNYHSFIRPFLFVHLSDKSLEANIFAHIGAMNKDNEKVFIVETKHNKIELPFELFNKLITCKTSQS